MSDVDEIYKNPAVKRKAKSDGKKQKKSKQVSIYFYSSHILFMNSEYTYSVCQKAK